MEEKVDRVRKKQRIVNSDFKKTFSTDCGKRVLYCLMTETNYHKPSFDADPHTMAFNNGMRSVVSRILYELNTNPIEMEKIAKEAYEYARSHQYPDGWAS